MSSSLSEEKENVNITNEFAKEDKVSTASSVLKRSQKENVFSLQQLTTPKKPPKVTFKNTPICHRPACYEAELLQSQLDTWEEIRCLDEVENWTERTQVVTKEDHQIHVESAIEFLEDIINNLPCVKYPEIQSEFTEATSKEEKRKSPNKIVEPIKSEVECFSSVKPSKTIDSIPDRIMDDCLDVDGAGPLDPAIASLTSLLKAGEDEERAFSPIGSERTSPDCDTMVTSEDIEKLLAPHDMPDDGHIPALELTHGNRIDALMDSKFSGKSLEEVTAKLDQLRMTSPKIEMGLNQLDNDEDFLPVKRRGAKTSPLAVKEPQEMKESQEEKENIPDSDDLCLPVKRREPKTVPKMEVESTTGEEKENIPDSDDLCLPVKRREPKTVSKMEVEPTTGEEKETFKKPLPPKPWKTKRKKIPKQEDPFDIIFTHANKNAVNGNDNVGEEASKNDDQKPQTSDTNSEGLSGDNTCSSDMSGQEKQPLLKENENQEEMKENTDIQDGFFGEKQEDFGLGNDDFKSSGDAFSLELDYLEKFGNTGNLGDRMSALARQSLYVKFDPLVKGLPDQDLRKMKADALNSKQTPGNLDDLLLMNTPPNRRAQQSRLAAIKETQDRDTTSLSGVDKLLTFSPIATTFNEDSQPQIKEETKSTTQASKSDSDDPSLVEPLLYSKSDIAVAVKKERETLVKQTHEESAIRDMEIQEIQSKLQAEVEGNSKLRRENDELRTVMNEYERTMAEMIETSEKNKNVSDESKNEVVKERDQLQADLNSVEAAFSDLHRRYEKLKAVLENYKKNEEILKKATLDYQEKLRKSGEKYQMLKKHAEEKIETANIEINRVRRSNDSEMAVMRAALKKEQNKSVSLEQAVQQKINENKELTAICDELIQRASGN